MFSLSFITKNQPDKLVILMLFSIFESNKRKGNLLLKEQKLSAVNQSLM